MLHQACKTQPLEQPLRRRLYQENLLHLEVFAISKLLDQLPTEATEKHFSAQKDTLQCREPDSSQPAQRLTNSLTPAAACSLARLNSCRDFMPWINLANVNAKSDTCKFCHVTSIKKPPQREVIFALLASSQVLCTPVFASHLKSSLCP
ncbi:JK_12P [Escherichia phage Jk06]|uniref:JK_12P n=1 Tax=Escherichia phage Jk06 TaxID=2886922 RepID=Q45Q03_9CAUD|nr:hypothetical protein JK_12 [Escherichia phage Jk06]AAZ29262.1 JK_12P [Escherichia phage Jk06]